MSTILSMKSCACIRTSITSQAAGGAYEIWVRLSLHWHNLARHLLVKICCPTLVEKAATLGYVLIQNHPFVDGNKRLGHAAMEVFLILNGYETDAPINEQESIIMVWLTGHRWSSSRSDSPS